MSVMQIPTQMHSCIRLPKRKVIMIYCLHFFDLGHAKMSNVVMSDLKMEVASKQLLQISVADVRFLQQE